MYKILVKYQEDKIVLSFKNDLEKSNRNFELIKKSIEEIFKVIVIAVETEDNELAKALDLYSGIDYILKNKMATCGLASRIQEGKNWRTFTIRKEKTTGATTEFEKRMYAIKNDFLTPTFTMQAYKGRSTIEYAICREKDLCLYASTHSCRTNHTDNAEFIIVNWDDIGTLQVSIDIATGKYTVKNKGFKF